MSALLTFATSKLGIITIAGLLVAALGAGIYVQGLRLDVARAGEATERSRADANAAVVKAMQVDAERANRIVADYAAEIAQMQERERDTRNSIVAAPVTAACVGSPAIRSLLQGVRREAGK
jgi:hypothetical protein